jgi:hypothetical protein
LRDLLGNEQKFIQIATEQLKMEADVAEKVFSDYAPQLYSLLAK